jgi:hypothetical protein
MAVPKSNKETVMASRGFMLRVTCAVGFVAFALAGCGNMNKGTSASATTGTGSGSTASSGTGASTSAGMGATATAGTSAQAQVYRATMSASQEVPPNSSTGTGNAEVRVDPSTNTISWRVTYSGLTGPATVAHIHGPAAPGANASPVFPFQNVTQQPIQGQASITPAQMADLAAGRMYVNVHTAQNPGGEIRGQLQKQ